MPTSIDGWPDALLIFSGSALESAVAQPEAGFGGEELYPDLASKTAALGHSLIQNHPFVDGNKRIGHATMEVFLLLNGHEIDASVDEREQIIIGVASGRFQGLTSLIGVNTSETLEISNWKLGQIVSWKPNAYSRRG